MDTDKLNYRGKYSVINGTEIADVNAREALLELNEELQNIDGVKNVTLSIVKTEDHKDAIKIVIDDNEAQVTLPEASLIESANFNQETHVLTIVLANGEDVTVNLSDLVDTYHGATTETTKTRIVNGDILVDVKDGAIKRNFLSDDVLTSLDSDKFNKVADTSLNVLSNGNYIVTNSEEDPCSLGRNGILRATKINEESFTQTWTTSLGEALRVVTMSETGVPTDLTITDENDVETRYTQPGEVQLSWGHTYTLSGTLSGHIFITTPIDNVGAQIDTDTTIILNGVYIYADSNRAIDYNLHEKTLNVNVAAGTVNTLYCDLGNPVINPDAVLYSSNNLELGGTGYLSIFSNSGSHGIKADRVKIIDSPHLYIDVQHDAIHGKVNSIEYKEDTNGNPTEEIFDLKLAVEMKGGYIYVKNANDVFGTDDNTDAEKAGSIRVDGGTIEVVNVKENIFDCKGVKNSIVEGFTRIIVPETFNWTSEKIRVLETVTGVPDTYTTKIRDLYYYKADSTTYLGCVLESTTTKDSSGNEIPGETTTHFITEDDLSTQLELSGNTIRVFGYINKKLILTTQSTDVTLVQAYIDGGIEYTPLDKKLYVKVETAGINAESEVIKPYENLSSYIVSEEADAIYSHKNLKINNDRPIFIKGNSAACRSHDLILNGDFDKYFSGMISATTVHMGADPDKILTAGNAKGFVYMKDLHVDHRTDKPEGKEEGIFKYYKNQKGNVLIDTLTMTTLSHVTTGRWDIASDAPSVLYIAEVVDGNNPQYVVGGFTNSNLTNGDYVASENRNGINYSGDWYKQTFNIDDYLLKSEKPNITTVTKTDLDSIFTGGWTVNFVKDDNCKEIVYYKTKDFIANDIVKLKKGETVYYSYDKDTKKKTYYEDGEANFIAYFNDGYKVDRINIAEAGNYNKIELETENVPGVYDNNGNAYNVTKVQGNLTITITSKAKSDTPDGFVVTFNTSHATINVYQMRNAHNADIKHTGVTSDYTVTGAGKDAYSDDPYFAQISFEVVCDDGYEVTGITPAANDGVTYKNLKIFKTGEFESNGKWIEEAKGATVKGHSLFSMTKICKNLDVAITVEPVSTGVTE